LACLNCFLEKNYYKSGKEIELPIKWCALEVIEFGKYSEKSDVWSFGIVLWELYSFGRIPYPAFNNLKTIEEVSKGYRLTIPEKVPAKLNEITLNCWKKRPDERPSFVEIESAIADEKLKIIKRRDVQMINISDSNVYEKLSVSNDIKKEAVVGYDVVDIRHQVSSLSDDETNAELKQSHSKMKQDSKKPRDNVYDSIGVMREIHNQNSSEDEDDLEKKPTNLEKKNEDPLKQGKIPVSEDTNDHLYAHSRNSSEDEEENMKFSEDTKDPVKDV